jgi:selenocysteine-specific elongation factor
MPLEYPNITLGTAGHIDHGKTALIKFLTGCDTDRLKAEKERGMSIDLGFAPCTIAGTQVGIVDVPGHENFVKTMVAGASGMDGCILVVAADDGVMPQTREHLEIVTLLGVRHGIVALTKVDRIAPDDVDGVRAQVRAFLHGTFLQDAPIVPMCNLTGEGFEAFYQVLADLVASITPRDTQGLFRLPVDRAFSAKGHGTIVAGIPVAGSATLGEEVLLLPQGQTGTIRGIQVYGRDTDTVLAGQCAALNVRGWDHRAIRRGDTVTRPGGFSAQEWFACELQLLAHGGLSLKNAAHVRFHTGTSDVGATVYLMEGRRLQPGEASLVQIRVQERLVAGPGDRFIVRLPAPVRTIGGGMIIEAVGGRLRRNRPGLREDLAERAEAARGHKSFVEYCLRSAEAATAGEEELCRRAKLPSARLRVLLGELVSEGCIVGLGSGLYVHGETLAEIGEKLLAIVAQHHGRAPDSPGTPADALREQSGVAGAAFDHVMAMLLEEGKLLEHDGRFALPEHSVALSDEDAAIMASIEAVFREGGFQPPDPEDVVDRASAPRERAERALRMLHDHGRLVQVEKLVFHREAVDRAREILEGYLRSEGRLESLKFKYLLDTTRKFAIPLLDHFDRVGVTQRVGNTRYLKGQKGPGPRG